ncbi:MAG TPA: glycosyltransferase [Candidatus Polarisedimenticolia bacterium]|nr:glycosyltransferase [Candidatus Polarisedimenticolia bacterium]
MRILKTVQAYYPFQDKGGPVVKVRALARGLAERGHEVTVLTADLGLRENDGFGMKVERCPWGWRYEEDGVEAIYLSTLGHYRSLTLNPRVIGFCRASLRRFDLVHFYGLYDMLGPAVSYFCRRGQTPYVIEPMGMYRPIDRSFRLKLIWRRNMGQAFWRNAAVIIATSEMERQELLDDGVSPEKLVIRYNGIDADSYASLPPRGKFRALWKVPAEQPLILFLSRLIPRKGADILIEAFAEVCPDLGWLVIAGPEGEPGYRSYLENRAKEFGVQARVIFTGPLYDDDKKAVMADANLFALPSRYENFANAAAEAMACGTPIIVSNSCGIRSLVEGKAGLVIAPEKVALAQALRRMLDDKVLYARLKEGCRRIADQLSWDRLTGQMEGHYAEVLANGNNIH